MKTLEVLFNSFKNEPARATLAGVVQTIALPPATTLAQRQVESKSISQTNE